MSSHRIVLFTNDSYFSYLLARRVIERHHESISVVVLSHHTSRSLRRLRVVWTAATPHYVAYRTVVHLLGVVHPRYRRRTVKALCSDLGVATTAATDIADLAQDERITSAEVGVAVNLDQRLSGAVLSSTERGVIGVHASRLPEGRGISPALWAFARGDDEIWVSLYRMVPALDAGPIHAQFAVPVEQSDSAFTMYRRVCDRAGAALAELVANLDEAEEPTAQPNDRGAETWPWPDRRHRAWMEASGRRLIRVRDLLGPT